MGLAGAEVLAATERGLAEDVAAQRQGFARFCRETLGVEAGVLLAALGVRQGDGGGAGADQAAVEARS